MRRSSGSRLLPGCSHSSGCTCGSPGLFGAMQSSMVSNHWMRRSSSRSAGTKERRPNLWVRTAHAVTGSVSRILYADCSARRSFLLAGHYCPAPATYPKVWRTEQARIAANRELPPYLVLLRVGFTLPRSLLTARCALTAPFHPYRRLATEAVCSLWHWPSITLHDDRPDVIRHTALWSSDFPLHGHAAWLTPTFMS